MSAILLFYSFETTVHHNRALSFSLPLRLGPIVLMIFDICHAIFYIMFIVFRFVIQACHSTYEGSKVVTFSWSFQYSNKPSNF